MITKYLSEYIYIHVVGAGRFRVYKRVVLGVSLLGFVLYFSFRGDIRQNLFIILVIGMILGTNLTFLVSTSRSGNSSAHSLGH